LLGHSWHHVPSDWTPKIGVPMTVRCERCDMERRDTVDRNSGVVVARRYTMPTDYQFLRGERHKRSDFRLAWVEVEMDKLRAARRERSAG
jgi:hypothetical protein